jgi:hypothetical protein
MMKTILVLGSGLMAESVITYLLLNPKVHLFSFRIAYMWPATVWRKPENLQKKREWIDALIAK